MMQILGVWSFKDPSVARGLASKKVCDFWSGYGMGSGRDSRRSVWGVSGMGTTDYRAKALDPGSALDHGGRAG